MDERDMSPGARASAAAGAYGAALRAAFERCGPGVTQKQLARQTSFSPTAVSRYLSGGRIADKDFLRALASFLSDHGSPLGKGNWRSCTGCAGRRSEPAGAGRTRWPDGGSRSST